MQNLKHVMNSKSILKMYIKKILKNFKKIYFEWWLLTLNFPFLLKNKKNQAALFPECKILKYNAPAVTTGGAREFNNNRSLHTHTQREAVPSLNMHIQKWSILLVYHNYADSRKIQNEVNRPEQKYNTQNIFIKGILLSTPSQENHSSEVYHNCQCHTSGAPAILSCNIPFLSLSSLFEYWIVCTWLKSARWVGCRKAMEKSGENFKITAKYLAVIADVANARVEFDLQITFVEVCSSVSFDSFVRLWLTT